MPSFTQHVIDMKENNFNELSASGRKRVLFLDNKGFCPKHAEAFAEEVIITAVGYVDSQRKSHTFCVACQQQQTFANKLKKP